MSIACTAVNFGADVGDETAAIGGVGVCIGGFVAGGGALTRSDDGGPVSVRIELSAGVSFVAGSSAFAVFETGLWGFSVLAATGPSAGMSSLGGMSALGG